MGHVVEQFETSADDRVLDDLVEQLRSAHFAVCSRLRQHDDASPTARRYALNRLVRRLVTDPDELTTSTMTPATLAFAARWRYELSTEEKLTLFVWTLVVGFEISIEQVAQACELAGTDLAAAAQHDRLARGQVWPLPDGRWAAQVGEHDDGELGTFPTAQAAYSAAHQDIRARRVDLRRRLADGGLALRVLAGSAWADPTVTGADSAGPSSQAEPQMVAVADLVSIASIARRAGVSAKTVQTWIGRHPGFPRGLNGTTVRSWPAVQQWLHDSGRITVPASCDPASAGHR